MADARGNLAELALATLIRRVSYKPGWAFGVRLGSPWAPTPTTCLMIAVQVTDSLSGQPMEVCHWIPFPWTTMDERQLRRWLFDQIVKVEQHEAMEFFKVDGVAPYFPDHEPGGDPYAVVDRDAPKPESGWEVTSELVDLDDADFRRWLSG